jgi:L-ribulose-5-phosphate 3-epimerase
MNIGTHPLGVCSWSLRSAGMAELVKSVKELGLEHIQLALTGLMQMDEKKRAEEIAILRASGLKLTAGMISFPGEDYSTIAMIQRTGGYVPDADWLARWALSLETAKLAVQLGIKLVSTHIGFVPHATATGFATIADRTRSVAQDFAGLGVDLVMETGPEPAADMRDFIEKLAQPNLFVNFDPANMLLYGAGEPIAALRLLAPHIRHIHLKDAIASKSPGKDWGEEVPFGSGQVGAGRFLNAVEEIGYRGPLVIEREAGNDRMGDVRKAIDSARSGMGVSPM